MQSASKITITKMILREFSYASFIPVLITVFMSLFIVSCSQSTTQTGLPEQNLPPAPAQTGDVGVPQPPARPETPNSAIAPPVKETEVSQEMPKELKELVARSDKKVQSYEFLYAPPPDNLPRDRYLIKGDKMRMKGYRINTVRNTEYFDNIYFDTSKKTAIAYCETREVRCANAKQASPVKYADYLIKTPYQWVKEITYGEIRGSEMLFDRTTKKVVYEKDGKTFTLWIDGDYGLAVRVQVDDGSKKVKYDYTDLAVNSVTDEMISIPKVLPKI